MYGVLCYCFNPESKRTRGNEAQPMTSPRDFGSEISSGYVVAYGMDYTNNNLRSAHSTVTSSRLYTTMTLLKQIHSMSDASDIQLHKNNNKYDVTTGLVSNNEIDHGNDFQKIR